MDGVAEDDLYITVYDTYTAAAGAIALDAISEEESDQLRGILLDLNNQLARAAVHYSSQGNSVAQFFSKMFFYRFS